MVLHQDRLRHAAQKVRMEGELRTPEIANRARLFSAADLEARRERLVRPAL